MKRLILFLNEHKVLNFIVTLIGVGIIIISIKPLPASKTAAILSGALILELLIIGLFWK